RVLFCQFLALRRTVQRTETMSNDQQRELDKAIEKIIRSQSRKRLIVAGPGTGKTRVYRKLLQSAACDRKMKLVLTYLINLKNELDENLSDLAGVFTFHGYCHFLLRKSGELQSGLTKDFKYFPGLASLIKEDWEITNKGESPKFVGLMRDLQEGGLTDFYLER